MLRRTAGLLVAAIALVLATAGTASAHPLGNFTVNHYAGIELAGDRVYVRYVLDLAEIPTFQFGDDVRAPGFASTVARSLELRLDARRVVLRPVAHRVVARRGAGSLKTVRFDAVFSAPASGSALTFADRVLPARIGWREITIAARDGARLLDASVPSASRSNELRAYPGDLLRSPLDVRSAVATFEPGTGAAPPPDLEPAPTPSHRGEGFEALIEHGELSAGVVLLSRFVVPEQLYPWLTLSSGLLVVAVGLGVLRQRMRARGGPGHHHHDAEGHDHHHHGHGHHHDHDDALTSRGILGVGIAAGLLPCPSALVVLLSAIALHRVGFGMALIVAFSIGLAATITAIGLLAVLARRAFSRARLDGPVVRALPAVSAAVIVLVGLAITARALPGVA